MESDSFTGADFEAAAGDSTSTPAATPDVSSPVDLSAQPEAATTAPAETTAVQPGIEPAKTGPIPFDVHKTALENARTKAVEEWKGKYGWAEQVNPQEFQQLQSIAKHFEGGDPIAGLQNLIAEIRKDPQHDAALRSLAAREMGRRTQQAEPQEPQPDLPIQLDDGRVVHLYSAEQQAKREAYLQQKWLAQVKQEFQPVTQTIESYKAKEAAFEHAQAVDRFVTTTYADVQTWPGMQDPETQKAVSEELARYRITEDDPREISMALDRAYRKVVLPKLQSSERRSVLDTLHQQANANTVNPAHTSTRAPKSMDEMSIAEALAHVAAQG